MAGRNLRGRATLGILVAGLCLSIGASLPGQSGWRLPLLWPVFSLPAWGLVGCLLGGLVRAGQAIASVTRQEKNERARASLLWFLAAAGAAGWVSALKETPFLLKGQVVLGPVAFVGLLASLVGSSAIAFWAARRLNASRLPRDLAVGAALTVGCVVFSVPMVWLLLTSFKDREDNTSTSGLVWVPQVTETHAYFDPERPLVATRYGAEQVTAALLSQERGVAQLEVERPYPLRGARFSAPSSTIRPVPREGQVVALTVEGESATGFVRRELVGGERVVELLAPQRFKGRVLRADPGETVPVRHPGLNLKNYSEALEWLPPDSVHGLVYLRNTLWLVLLSVVGTLFSCSLVAYGFARVRFPGRAALFNVMVATMMLPGAVTLLPRFLIWRGVGAVDTLVPIWLPTFFASAFYVFLLRQFFKTLPIELEDAARIDGCGPLATYWRVMLPQIKPALAVIGVWTFMGAWNDFMSPLIYVSSQDKMPVSYAIQMFHSDRGGEFGLMMAFATMATIPVVVVFFLGQRYFVEGVQLSGLGGR